MPSGEDRRGEERGEREREKGEVSFLARECSQWERGGRRQFRADGRRNHPRPCSPWLPRPLRAFFPLPPSRLRAPPATSAATTVEWPHQPAAGRQRSDGHRSGREPSPPMLDRLRLISVLPRDTRALLSFTMLCPSSFAMFCVFRFALLCFAQLCLALPI